MVLICANVLNPTWRIEKLINRITNLNKLHIIDHTGEEKEEDFGFLGAPKIKDETSFSSFIDQYQDFSGRDEFTLKRCLRKSKFAHDYDRINKLRYSLTISYSTNKNGWVDLNFDVIIVAKKNGPKAVSAQTLTHFYQTVENYKRLSLALKSKLILNFDYKFESAKAYPSDSQFNRNPGLKWE